MSAPIAAAILAELLSHRGLENAITAPQIAVAVGINERDVRAAIASEIARWERSEWSRHGLLLSRPGHGFFFATDAEEVNHCQYGFILAKLNAGQKLSQIQAAMRVAGFGGLVTNKIPETFTNASHPERA